MSSKTSAGELFNRYVWLADVIYSAGRITYEEVARKWKRSYWNNDGSELPLRTFRNHLAAVEELFDINIACDRKDGYRYHIENIDDIESGSLRKWMLSTLTVKNTVSESRDLRNRILLEEIPSGQQFLSVISDAMRDGATLDAVHRSFWRDEEYEIHLEPYCLKLFKQRWYVFGRDLDKDSPRIYALDRLVQCHAGSGRFKLPEDFDAEAFFSDFFGVYVDPDVPMERVRLRVDGPRRNFIRSLPLHHSQEEVELGKDSSIFEYRIRPMNDFIFELVSMSSYAKVLEPEWLAEKIQASVEEMLANIRK